MFGHSVFTIDLGMNLKILYSGRNGHCIISMNLASYSIGSSDREGHTKALYLLFCLFSHVRTQVLEGKKEKKRKKKRKEKGGEEEEIFGEIKQLAQYCGLPIEWMKVWLIIRVFLQV